MRMVKIRVAKMVLMFMIVVVAVACSSAQGRNLKDQGEQVKQPQNFVGGFGTSGGFVPTPGGGVRYDPGPTVFCAFPGPTGGCLRVEPIIPGGIVGTGGTGTGTGTPP
ncbi:hypothetical protein CCACVL1_09715 [Corchorus capsularis]|uniref:Lipoprotein n=1 Tax=Corchorus capsularis TaxID=210143 RepID=A0A1R3IUI0_COCAP|nr:hypothetical protein CCACVL1_09715 [Corchorus capsularis]